MAKQLNVSESVTPAVEAPNISKGRKEASKEKIQQFIKEETRMVKGMFQCFETPGATVTITCRKYPGIPEFKKAMTDGYEYEIPLYVARFLNGIDVTAGALGDPNKRNQRIGTCSYPVHGFKWNPGQDLPKGQEGIIGREGAGTVVPLVGISKVIRRYGFQSTEFAGVTE